MTSGGIRFAGRRALVTGASRGIGAAIARRLLAEGADVLLVARDTGSAATVLAAGGARGSVLRADLADPVDVERLADVSIDRGHVDVVVNAAGFAFMRRAGTTSADDIARVLAVDLVAPMLIAARLGAHMAAAGRGSIVNVSSVASFAAAPYAMAYAAAKAGLEAATRSMAAEWAPRGVRVNAVAPGVIRTDLSQAVWSDESRRASVESHIGLRRLGTADEIADVVCFLASDDAAYVTGQTIVADGLAVGVFDPT